MLKDKFHDWTRASIRAALIVVALGCVSLTHAQVPTGPTGLYYDRFRTSGGIDMMTGPGPAVTGRQAAGQLIWDKAVKTDGGMPKVDGGADMPNPSGRPVPVKGSARIPGSAIAGAVGRAGAKILPGISIAIALKELAEELGFGLSKNPDGTLATTKTAPGREYSFQFASGWYSTVLAAAQAYATYHGVVLQSCNGATETASCSWRYSNGSPYNTAGPAVRDTAPVTTPVDYQEFVDAVAAKSGWPSGSKVSEVLRQDIEAGGKPDIGPISVTGPATSSGPTVTTTNTTNNTTTTSNTTHNHTYAGNTVTTTTNVTSVTINNTTGDTISSTTTVTPNEAPEEEKPKCPEGDTTAGCSDLDTPELDIPRETKTITYQEENVFGAGSCPANMTAFIGTLGKTVTVWDWAKTCEMALPLRALVLLLASFAAFLIVMPGSTRT